MSKVFFDDRQLADDAVNAFVFLLDRLPNGRVVVTDLLQGQEILARVLLNLETKRTKRMQWPLKDNLENQRFTMYKHRGNITSGK